MKAIIVTPKFGGSQRLMGPYSQEDAEEKKRVMEEKKIIVSMDFPKPVRVCTCEIVTLNQLK